MGANILLLLNVELKGEF